MYDASGVTLCCHIHVEDQPRTSTGTSSVTWGIEVVKDSCALVFSVAGLGGVFERNGPPDRPPLWVCALTGRDQAAGFGWSLHPLATLDFDFSDK